LKIDTKEHHQAHSRHSVRVKMIDVSISAHTFSHNMNALTSSPGSFIIARKTFVLIGLSVFSQMLKIYHCRRGFILPFRESSSHCDDNM
jgi:hypothetical protein